MSTTWRLGECLGPVSPRPMVRMLLVYLADAAVDPHDQRREACCAGRREDHKSERPKRRVSRICGVAFSSKGVVHWPLVVDTAISNGPETYQHRPLQFVIHLVAGMDGVVSAKLEGMCVQPCQHTISSPTVVDEVVAERLQCPSAIHNGRAIPPRGERALSS